jgi:hypothetical protein
MRHSISQIAIMSDGFLFKQRQHSGAVLSCIEYQYEDTNIGRIVHTFFCRVEEWMNSQQRVHEG